MKKVLALFLTSLLLVACSEAKIEPNVATPTETRPTIWLIGADDLGYSDSGACGGEICTPAVDARAAGGADCDASKHAY